MVKIIYQGLLIIVCPMYCSIYHFHIPIISVEEVPKVYQYFVIEVVGGVNFSPKLVTII